MIVGLALVVGAVILAAVGVWHQRSVDVLTRRQTKRLVVVELHNGETFRGLLAKVDGRCLELVNVEAISHEQAQPVAVDGALLIPRGDVKYVQRP